MELIVIDTICAGIVTYNPNIDRLKKNINTIYSQVDKIFIVDNGSQNFSFLRESINSDLKISIIEKEKNEGIAQALNDLLSLASESNYQWIITLDQDSICEKNLINKYLYSFNKYKDKSHIGIVGPEYFQAKALDTKYSKLEDAKFVITSGALTNVKKAIKSGGFEIQYFIDAVDWELCLKLKSKNYKSFIAKNTYIDHQLGESKFVKFFHRTFYYNEHSSFRYYYLNRNCISLLKRYIFIFPKDVMWVIRRVVNKNLKMIIFEANRFLKIKMIIRGIIDGLFDNMGEYKE